MVSVNRYGTRAAGVVSAATALWATGDAIAQPLASFGSPLRVEIGEVLVSGLEYPGIGTVRSLNTFEVSDACWLGVHLVARESGTDNAREVIATGLHRFPLVPLAVGGRTLPGTTMTPPPLQAFSQFRMARRGAIAFVSNFTQTGSTGTGLFTLPGSSNPVRLVARNFDQAPGLPQGVTYLGLAGSPVLDPAGILHFTAALSGPNITTSNDRAVYVAPVASSAQLLFSEGAPISSLGNRPIGFFNDLNSTPTSFGPLRVFTASLGTPGVPAVLAGMPLTAIATREGSLPTDPSVRYSEFLPGPSIGRGAEFAFTATLMGNRVDSTNNWAIVTSSQRVVARAGQQAPGLPQGTNYLRFSTPLLYSSSNHVLFHASLQGPNIGDLNRSALFAGPADAIGLIVRSGTQAPSCPQGVLIGTFSDQFNSDPIYINPRGDIVLRTQLRGPSVTPSNDFALFAYSAAHGLQLIAREGDSIRLAGETRTIQTLIVPERVGSVSQTNGLDGRRTILNPHGECFFAVRCTDGTEALLKAQVNEPPCPADFNGDRFVDCFDYDAFVFAFEAGDPAADQDEDGFIDGFDYEAFVAAFESDC